MTKKILFIASHRMDRAPGQRYRFEQYFDFYLKNNIECHLSFLLSEKDDSILYNKGKYFQKALIAVKAYFKRFKDLRRIKDYDLVIIYREAILTRSVFFEKKIVKKGVPVLYDFDDAIWVKDVSAGNKMLSFLKNENKIEKILPLCTHVTAGNSYLRDFALRFNKNVTIFPSTIDTGKYKHLPREEKEVVTIGWVGSHTTVKHFEELIPVLLKLKERYRDRIQIEVIGDPDYHNEMLEINGIPWNNEQEVELFNRLDIGIMPLPENEWTLGKCGMKGLLYMAVETPAVISNVGMNTEIIQDGENGFLPKDEEEWFVILSTLIENRELRRKIGKKGRETIEQFYSLKSQQEKYLELYLSLMKD